VALPGGSAPVPTSTQSVASPGTARPAAPSSTPAVRPGTYPAPATRTHVVELGDNVYRLALRYGVTVEQIARANNLDERYSIRRGQVLVIP
jgi:LysM repeat protein